MQLQMAPVNGPWSTRERGKAAWGMFAYKGDYNLVIVSMMLLRRTASSLETQW